MSKIAPWLSFDGEAEEPPCRQARQVTARAAKPAPASAYWIGDGRRDLAAVAGGANDAAKAASADHPARERADRPSRASAASASSSNSIAQRPSCSITSGLIATRSSSRQRRALSRKYSASAMERSSAAPWSNTGHTRLSHLTCERCSPAPALGELRGRGNGATLSRRGGMSIRADRSRLKDIR